MGGFKELQEIGDVRFHINPVSTNPNFDMDNIMKKLLIALCLSLMLVATASALPPMPIYHWDAMATTTTIAVGDVNKLRATPITLVPAQGTNTFIELVSAVVVYDYATAAFTVGADEDLVIEYADGTDASGTIETAGFLDQTDDELRYVPNVLAVNADIEASLNQGLRLFNSGSGETADGGASVLRIIVHYRVYRVGL